MNKLTPAMLQLYLIFLIIFLTEVITKLSMEVVSEAEHVTILQPDHRMSASTWHPSNGGNRALVWVQPEFLRLKFCWHIISSKPLKEENMFMFCTAQLASVHCFKRYDCKPLIVHVMKTYNI